MTCEGSSPGSHRWRFDEMIKTTYALLVLVFSTGALASENDPAGAKVHEYFELFNARDVQTIAHEIYSSPVHIGGGTGHSVYADPSAAIESLNSFYGQLDEQGWKASVIDHLEICQLSDTLALVDTRFSRVTGDGEPIPPALRTTLYVVQVIDGAWRIVAFYSHDADKRPSCN